MGNPTIHVHHADVTFDMLDPGNVLYHANHLVLADRARAGLFEAVGHPLHELWATGRTLIVRSIAGDYRAPIFAGAKLTVLTKLTHRSRRSLRLLQRVVPRSAVGCVEHGAILSPDQLDTGIAELCRIEVGLVFVNAQEGCLEAIPAPIARALDPDGHWECPSQVPQNTGATA